MVTFQILFCGQRKLQRAVHSVGGTFVGGDVPELQDFLKRVFSITCVISGAERNCSIFGFLHSKNRNGLYNNKVTKLVFVYQNHRALRRFRRTGNREPIVKQAQAQGIMRSLWNLNVDEKE